MREKLVLKKSAKKILWTIILVLIGMIVTKKNPELKVSIEEYLYEKSLPMMQLKNKYDTYFSWNIKDKTKMVLAEKIPFKNAEKTETGVKLTVSNQQTIPVLESGMIILVDHNTVIIEQIDGITATYQNIEMNQYKLYDYLEKGDCLGVSSAEEVYISFSKEGNYYDYKKYL